MGPPIGGKRDMYGTDAILLWFAVYTVYVYYPQYLDIKKMAH